MNNFAALPYDFALILSLEISRRKSLFPRHRTFHNITKPCRVGSVGSVSASRTVGREFASRPGDTKDHHKNGANCLPAWHACVRVGVWQCNPTV